MPNWEDVSNRLTNMAVRRPANASSSKRAARSSRFPPTKAMRNLTNSSASGTRSGMVAGRQICFLLQRQIRRVQTRDRSAGRTHAAARDHDRETDALLHAIVVARFEEALFTDTNLKVWVLDVATEKAKIVGQDPWMVPQRTLNPAWSPDSKWVAYSVVCVRCITRSS